MKRISQETERKLLAAIDSTAGYINEGLSPNDAIIKVAAEHEINRSEIPMVVHAYNTGRTNRQRQDTSDILTKVATFELADADVIIDRLYPQTVKTAAARYQSTVISDDYSSAPTAVVQARSSMEKRARYVELQTLNGEKVPDATSLPYAEGQKFLKDMIDLRTKQSEMEEYRRQSSQMVDILQDTMQKLSHYFVSASAIPYPIIKTAACMLHGQACDILFNTFESLHPNVVTLYRNTHDVEKRANAIDCIQQPFPIINLIFKQSAECVQKKAAYAASITRYKEKAAAIKRPLEPAISPSIYEDVSIMDEPLEKYAEGALSNPVKMMGAYSIMRSALTPMMNRVQGPDDTTKINKLMSQLNDPAHEQKLRLINTHGLLTDLMTNDDVISGYDPNEVADAFSEISQISPSVSDQRGIVQGLLRKRLAQGSMDSFEHGQLLDFEQKLRQQSTPISGGQHAIG